MAGEAWSQPGVGEGSETGPVMGGLRVALRTLSVVCCLLRESDPRAYWHQRARTEDTAVNITFVQGGAQEPQSGFLGRRGLRRGAAGRVKVSVWSQNNFFQSLWSRSSKLPCGLQRRVPALQEVRFEGASDSVLPQSAGHFSCDAETGAHSANCAEDR